MAVESLAEEACSNLGLTELKVFDPIVGSFVESLVDEEEGGDHQRGSSCEATATREGDSRLMFMAP